MTDKPFNPPEKRSGSAFLLMSLVLAIILILVMLMPIEPSDYWTYLRIGDEIVKTRQIPQTEFMTYTSAGEPALYSYWLASLVFLGVYKTGGVALTLLVTALCVGSLYVFLWLCLRELKVGTISASLLLLFTALMGSSNWSTRPQIFAYPLFGLALWLLLRWQHGKTKGLYGCCRLLYCCGRTCTAPSFWHSCFWVLR